MNAAFGTVSSTMKNLKPEILKYRRGFKDLNLNTANGKRISLFLAGALVGILCKILWGWLAQLPDNQITQNREIPLDSAANIDAISLPVFRSIQDPSVYRLAQGHTQLPGPTAVSRDEVHHPGR